jgi:hypothetical protein
MAALLAVLLFLRYFCILHRIPFEENYKQQLGVILRMPPFVLLAVAHSK